MPAFSPNHRSARLLRYALAAAAVIYAFLAGLKTVAEFDLGWQLATGRRILANHRIPSTDVFSYTAAGHAWIYPVGSGLIFYLIFLAGGYALLSWFTALVSAIAVALVLRRGSAKTAALAVIAVAPITSRINARAEMFTVVLFALTISLLWENRTTGKARLWMLPLIMAAWVNLHPGFIAGLALIAAYLMLDLLDGAWSRLRSAWPWLCAACFATLINPWGWKIYKAVARQQDVMGAHSALIQEWKPLPTNWAHIQIELFPLAPDTSYFILLIALVAMAFALLRRRFGEAILLASAVFLATQHQRFISLAAIVVVVVGGASLSSALPAIRQANAKALVASAFVCLAFVRAANLVTGQTYRSADEMVGFGAGISWCLPSDAADFVVREHLPREVFAGYSEGAFLMFRLGPQYKDFIDSRAIPFGSAGITHSALLKSSPPDSPLWRAEIGRYGINTIVVPLGRYFALQQFPVLTQFCTSDIWRPVYLDEVSAVFLRRSPQTERLIEELQIDCETTPLPKHQGFEGLTNGATVLRVLGRNREALEAASRAIRIHPDFGYLYYLRGRIHEDMGDGQHAELDLVRATKLVPDLAAPWSSLATHYQRANRLENAIVAWQKAASASESPWKQLQSLGYCYLQAHRPLDALDSFNEAVTSLPPHPELIVNEVFLANTAHGKALIVARYRGFTAINFL